MARCFVLLTLLTLSLFAEIQPDFQKFLSWYETYQGSLMPPDVLKSYQAHLAAQGATPEQLKATLETLMATMRNTPREFTVLHFNKIYAAPNQLFRDAPSALLVKLLPDWKPGAALDVAMGQGRNALYLASQGWQVTGYDLSPGGLAAARAAAGKANLKLNLVQASHDEFDYGQDRWDLIVEAYAFTDFNNPAYRARLLASLKPGGVLFIEGFAGPKNELLRLFPDLKVVYFEDRADVADWSLQRMNLARFVAIK